jgi:hypothetical protein
LIDTAQSLRDGVVDNKALVRGDTDVTMHGVTNDERASGYVGGHSESKRYSRRTDPVAGNMK